MNERSTLLGKQELEHRQLAETICTTDGISMEIAELQVTAFEKQFNDDTRQCDVLCVR